MYKRFAEIALNLLEDVPQRGWHDLTRINRESESVGLSCTVIRVLPEDDHLHFLKRAEIKGTKDILGCRIHCPLLVFLLNKLCELGKIGLRKLTLEVLLPRHLYCYFHCYRRTPSALRSSCFFSGPPRL